MTADESLLGAIVGSIAGQAPADAQTTKDPRIYRPTPIEEIDECDRVTLYAGNDPHHYGE